MESICRCICYVCCSGCCRQRFEKTDVKQKKDLKPLETLRDSRQPKMFSANPLDMKTEQMTDIHKIPNKEFKTEHDVLRSLGFRIDYFIDSGAFATVEKATHLTSGLEVAIKKILIPEDLDPKSAKKRKNLLIDVKNELYVMQTIIHPHIIRLIHHFMITSKGMTVRNTLYIVMQFAKGGNLSKMCDKFAPFSEKTCKIWFAQMLSAMGLMHGKGMAHRDLKLSNVLLDEHKDVLISDFGLTRVVWRESQDKILDSKTFCGTPPYMAPEILSQFSVKRENAGYNALAVDVWALGVILFRLFNRYYPFPQKRRKAIKYMNKKIYFYNSDVDTPPTKALIDIIEKIFEPNPKLRPKLEDLQKHQWIKLEFERVEQKSIKTIQSYIHNKTHKL